MPEVEAYVKNHNLGFAIPYTFEGQEHEYIPDFIVRIATSPMARSAEPDHRGVRRQEPEKAAKVETARTSGCRR